MKRIFILILAFIWAFVWAPFVPALTDEEEDVWLDDEEDMPIGATADPAEDSPVLKSTKKADSAKTPEEDETTEITESTGESSQAETDIAQAEEESDDSLLDSKAFSEKSTDSDTAQEELATASPSDEYEQNLYETYTEYYSKKVSVEEWNNIAGNKDTYTIQTKDTLWDISKMLFNDPNYWPKLWSVNPSLGNPHLIQPQDILGFVHGTEGAPPYLTMVKKGGSANLPDFAQGQNTGLQVGGKSKPVINIPSSLPPLYLRKKEPEQMDWKISTTRRNLETMSFLSYYMTSRPLSAVGRVADKKDYGSWFHVGQSVLLEMREPVNPGQKLTIINDMGKLYSSTMGVRGPFGYQQQVQGEVEIVGRLPDSFDLYEARVTKSLNPLSLKAFVVNHSLVAFDHRPTDRTGTGSAQIIGVPTMFAHEKHLASPSDFVYLNRGRGNGLSVGEMYQVRANLDIQTRRRKYGYDIKVGEIKIVHTGDRFATALVTAMHNPIHVGDYISPLDKGLSIQKGYDPFADDDIEEVPADDTKVSDDFREFEDSTEMATADKSPEQEEAIELDPGEEDVFEAFE